MEQLAHRALVGLPVAFFQTRAAHAYIDGMGDRELKQLLLKAADRIINEGLYQAMKMEASRATAKAPARKQKLTGGLLGQASFQIAEGRDSHCAGSAGPPGNCAETAGGVRVKETRIPETSKCR